MSEIKKSIRPRIKNPNYIQEVLNKYKDKQVKFYVKEKDVPFFLAQCMNYINTEKDEISEDTYKALIHLKAMISALTISSSTIQIDDKKGKKESFPLTDSRKTDFLVKYFKELETFLGSITYTNTMRAMDIYQIIVICKIPIKIVRQWMQLCYPTEENLAISSN